MERHIHLYEYFIEKGCKDDKVFLICRCGHYRELGDV